ATSPEKPLSETGIGLASPGVTSFLIRSSSSALARQQPKPATTTNKAKATLGSLREFCLPAVPKGHLKIAQRFSVGEHPSCKPSPEGRAAPKETTGVSRPCGPPAAAVLIPTLKRWATVACPFGTRNLSAKSNRSSLIQLLVWL